MYELDKSRQYIHNFLFGGNDRHQNHDHHLSFLSPERREAYQIAGFLVSPNLLRVWGTDISPWDGNVNLDVTKSYGASFVFIKGLDGTLQVKYFVDNRARALGAGLLHAPYQWLYRNANISGKSQAQAMDTLLQKYPPTLPPVIDFEWTRWLGAASNPNYTDLEIWVDEYLRLGNPLPLLYTAPGYANMFGSIPAGLRAKFRGLWVAHYYVQIPTLPAGFSTYLFHQQTDSADAAIYSPNDVNTLEVDVNYYGGDHYQFQKDFQEVPTPVVTRDDPYPGVEYYKGVVNGVNYHVLLINMQGKRAHVTNLHGGMETVSSVAKRLDAQIVVNADDYAKQSAPPYYPTSLAVSDGAKYVNQFEFRKFLNISKDNVMRISHNDLTNLYNTTSFIRPLITSGIREAYLSDTSKVEVTEIHARSAKGLTRDGRLIIVCVEGKVDPATGIAYEGCTLPQLSDVILEYGGYNAGEHGGGGDMSLWIRDRIVTSFSDPTERPTVQQLAIFIGEEPVTAKNKVTIIFDNGARERQKPRVNSADTYGTVLADNTIHYSDFDEVPDMDYPNDTSKRWIQLQSGWYIATQYAGAKRAIVEPVVITPPPPPPVTDDLIEIYVNGTLKYSITGKLTVS